MISGWLTSLARERGLTLNTLVQVAWGVLLGRMTGRDDVVFGATVSGRPPELAGVESMIGLFINTVPVRVRVDPAEPVAALLTRVQDEQAALMEHQYLGLADIQRAAGLGELFDTLLVFENYPDDGGADAGLPIADLDGPRRHALSAHARRASRASASSSRSPTAGHVTDARDLLTRLGRILAAFATDPDGPVHGIDLLTGTERRRVLHEWNDTGHEVPRHDRGRAVPRPGRPVRRTRPRWSSTDLRADLRASWTRASPRLARRAGGERRRAGEGRRAGAAALGRPGRRDAGRAPGGRGVPAARPRPPAAADRGDARGRRTGRRRDAGVARRRRRDTPSPYRRSRATRRTSSTPRARPGGPRVSSCRTRAIVNRLLWMQDRYGLTPGDRVLQKTPAGFDVSVWEFFWPLVTGATLVVARPDGHRDPAYLARLIAGQRVTRRTSCRRCWRRSSPSRPPRTAPACAGCSAAARRCPPSSPTASVHAARRRAAQPVRADRGVRRRHLLAT